MADMGKPAAEVVKYRVGSIIHAVQKKALFDTAGLYKAPVKVLKARPIDREYSSYRDAYLSFRNVSSKRIEGIKFRWYGENASESQPIWETYQHQGLGLGLPTSHFALVKHQMVHSRC